MLGFEIRPAIAAVVLCWVASPAAAQVISSSLDGVEVPPRYYWRLGDEASFAQPSAPLEDWQSLGVEAFPKDWRGIGWLRFEVRVVETAVGRPIGLRLSQEGAAEVWLDGKPIHAFGTPSATAAGERPDRTRDPRPLIFEDAGSHTLAVRYSAWILERPRWAGEKPVVVLRLGELREMSEERLRLVRLLTFHQMFLTGLFLAFALLNLMLYLFRPVAGPNLFCGLAAASAAATVFLNFGAYVQREPAGFFDYYTLFLVAFVALALSSLLFVYSCVTRRPPRHFMLFAGAGAALALWALAQPVRAQPLGMIFMLAANAEMIRAAVARRAAGEEPRLEDTWILGLGAIPLAVFSPYQLLAGLEVVPTLWDFVVFPSPYYGLAVLMFSMTVFLGRDFARTQRRLERQLDRVQRLSEEKLEQERLAREKEVERARLEVENRRRAEELEEARRLQTSMLPSEVPASPHLEITVHAETATEVGGDYYDFLPSEDGLTVIVGDASGHGAQAGSLVAATKGMLLTYVDPSPAACLDRVSGGLRKMGLRRRHMALVAARFTADGRHVTLAAAAMPPVLIYRAADRGVESVIIPSLPLGSFRDQGYEETTKPLEPGDRVVLMSDGLPEAMDSQLEPVGYDRVEALVAEHGHRSGPEMIEALVEVRRHQTGGGRPDDDVTLMVVEIRQGPDATT